MGKGYNKYLVRRWFDNPHTGKPEDFVLYGQKDWSVVLAVTEDDLVLLVDQFKQGCEQIITELPAGTADFVEKSPLDVMRAELLGETGFGTGEVIALAPQWIATRNSPTRFHPFLALGCVRKCDARYDREEMIEWSSTPLDVWLRMVFMGEITEPSAVVTTMLALPHLVSRSIITTDEISDVLQNAAAIISESSE